jgi:hypothetical protein
MPDVAAMIKEYESHFFAITKEALDKAKDSPEVRARYQKWAIKVLLTGKIL